MQFFVVVDKAYSVFFFFFVFFCKGLNSSQFVAAPDGERHQSVLQPHVIGKLALLMDHRLILSRTALIATALALLLILVLQLLLLQFECLLSSPLLEAQIEGQADE